MTLSDHANAKGQPPASHKEIEQYLRNDLAPLIEFLERAAEIDGGYPDAFPADEKTKPEYREDGLNIDHIGCTLEHSINFSKTGESHDARNGHGRYLEVTAHAKEHRLYGDESRIFNITLFEDGKSYEGLGAYLDEIDQEFDRKEDVTKAIRDVIAEYVSYSSRINNDVDAALERGQKMMEIANDVLRAHFGLTRELEIDIRDGRLVTGFLSSEDITTKHTAD